MDIALRKAILEINKDFSKSPDSLSLVADTINSLISFLVGFRVCPFTLVPKKLIHKKINKTILIWGIIEVIYSNIH
ncbi:hypothetical protein [Flavobacterium sp. WC2509]|uniref:hypothetical protein n=1 Tax=Flavobacterium sp. WC2509 TaxID=3461406 RepID=UPI0040449A62